MAVRALRNRSRIGTASNRGDKAEVLTVLTVHLDQQAKTERRTKTRRENDNLFPLPLRERVGSSGARNRVMPQCCGPGEGKQSVRRENGGAGRLAGLGGVLYL
jgi:hypothetical protein